MTLTTVSPHLSQSAVCRHGGWRRPYDRARGPEDAVHGVAAPAGPPTHFPVVHPRGRHRAQHRGSLAAVATPGGSPGSRESFEEGKPGAPGVRRTLHLRRRHHRPQARQQTDDTAEGEPERGVRLDRYPIWDGAWKRLGTFLHILTLYSA